jgi:hypothetical protein
VPLRGLTVNVVGGAMTCLNVQPFSGMTTSELVALTVTVWTLPAGS